MLRNNETDIKDVLRFILLLCLGLLIVGGIRFVRENKNNGLPSVGSCRNCNIVVIDIDVLRSDALDCKRNVRRTPNLCNFLRSSFFFTDHISHAALTRPSFFSFLTSLYPVSHNIWNQFNHPNDPSMETIMSILSRYGYRSYFVGSMSTQLQYDGFDRKFPNWNDALASEEIREAKGPFFLFIYPVSLHFPYMTREAVGGKVAPDNKPMRPKGSPASWDEFENQVASHIVRRYQDVFTQRIILMHPELFGSGINDHKNEIYALYKTLRDGSEADNLLLKSVADPEYDTFFSSIDGVNPEHVRYLKDQYLQLLSSVDDSMKDLFSFLSSPQFVNNTIVVLRSDHGEAFFEHGKFSHRGNLYQELIHTPLMISLPRFSGKPIRTSTSDVDVLPTLVDLVGIAPPAQAQGRSLVPLMRGLQKKKDTYQISQKNMGEVATYREGDWKLIIIEGKASQLYRLSRDPSEQENVVEKEKARAGRLLQKYTTLVESFQRYNSNIPAFPEEIGPMKRDKMFQQEGYF